MNVENFISETLSEQKIILTHHQLETETYNDIIDFFYNDIDKDTLIASIEALGSKLSEKNIKNLISLNDKEIMTAIASNYQVKLTIHQVRDLTRLVDDDVIKQHPDFKEFWYETYVQKEEEFLQHTLQHIKNVNILADEVIDFILEDEELKSYFNIPKEGVKNKELKKIIRDGIKLHDKAKVCTDEDFLEENGLEEPLYKTLYSHYGKGLTPELKEVVKKLNDIDESIISNYLKDHSDWIQNLFFKIERISDCIERGCNKVTPEEMNQDKMKPSVYLEKTMNPMELKIVRFFEENYHTYCKEKF